LFSDKVLKVFSAYEKLNRALNAVGQTPCQANPEAYFPEKEQAISEYENRQMAYRLCQDCPVILECLNYAVEANEKYGIWGGLTTAQRQKLQNRKVAKKWLG
tara:strand:- start:62 stop:367 length:306 start_codon:yes stop_codon:yes gene_type:complete